MRDLPVKEDVKKPPHPVYPKGNAYLDDNMIQILNAQIEAEDKAKKEAEITKIS